jgi:hypothetical protein
MRWQWGIDVRLLHILTIRDGSEYWLADIPNPAIQKKIGVRYVRIKKHIQKNCLNGKSS